ncbi:MAG: AI-2E family transporter [Verrucomicrobiales bacterium]|nr:AI-2E family transporter [Verrucomicrobiales bacterium]
MPKSPEPPIHPTPFQRKTLWTGITALSMVTIGCVIVGLIWLSSTILGYLQPVLVPLAVAGIIAYLLEPIIRWLQQRNIKHHRAVLIVYVGFILAIVLLATAVIVPTFGQADELFEKRELIQQQVTEGLKTGISQLQGKFGSEIGQEYYQRGVTWLSEEGPAIVQKVGTWFWSRISGVFGFFGYLLGLFLVPIYLYYFLMESQSISKQWSDYLPLKASNFKDEVVATLSEINQYLIAFFRGQMLVSMIDGALVGIALAFMGLDYALLIGVFVALLGLIPYIGNLLCLIPALLISVAQFSDPNAQWTWLQHTWAYPLIVLILFTGVQQVNSLFTAPKIVGESVGLHPLTIIFSILFWSLLMGGLLGALLAVPMTASLKVLFQRYVWDRRLSPQAIDGKNKSSVSEEAT